MNKADRKKIRYYNDGIATVCLLLDDNNNVISRGISICSGVDIFITKDGRRYAYRRALEAAGRKENCARIKYLHKNTKIFVDRLNISLTIDRFGEFKGYYKPELTNTEKLFLLGSI